MGAIDREKMGNTAIHTKCEFSCSVDPMRSSDSMIRPRCWRELLRLSLRNFFSRRKPVTLLRASAPRSKAADTPEEIIARYRYPIKFKHS
jgi:hypothetical protein